MIHSCTLYSLLHTPKRFTIISGQLTQLLLVKKVMPEKYKNTPNQTLCHFVICEDIINVFKIQNKLTDLRSCHVDFVTDICVLYYGTNRQATWYQENKPQ